MTTTPDTSRPSTPLGHARPRGVERREARGLIWFAAAAVALCLLVAISFNLVVSKTLRTPYTSPHTQSVTRAAPAAAAAATPTATAATAPAAPTAASAGPAQPANPAAPAPEAASPVSGGAAASQPAAPSAAPPTAAPPG